MKFKTAVIAALAMAPASCAISGNPPGRPAPESQVTRPDKVMDFESLYSSNCAGCHGSEGKGGAAVGLANPVYLAIADDATIRRVVSDGVPGTAMPAFARQSGGMLTNEQVDAIVTTDSPRPRHPLTHAIHGEDCGFFERRAQESACRMGEVMLTEKNSIFRNS